MSPTLGAAPEYTPRGKQGAKRETRQRLTRVQSGRSLHGPSCTSAKQSIVAVEAGVLQDAGARGRGVAPSKRAGGVGLARPRKLRGEGVVRAYLTAAPCTSIFACEGGDACSPRAHDAGPVTRQVGRGETGGWPRTALRGGGRSPLLATGASASARAKKGEEGSVGIIPGWTGIGGEQHEARVCYYGRQPFASARLGSDQACRSLFVDAGDKLSQTNLAGPESGLFRTYRTSVYPCWGYSNRKRGKRDDRHPRAYKSPSYVVDNRLPR
ncbi:hypothetical protein B0H10DRAFT_1957727 [Mycena sp. CBHHK59/15]|nr:hypothetical protein B0H10DRAFT_1957727 [Mycena sp. CBHHK59/15]